MIYNCTNNILVDMEARETYVQSKAEKDRLKQEIKNERKKNEPMLKEFEDANKKYNETRDRWNNAKRVVNEVKNAHSLI